MDRECALRKLGVLWEHWSTTYTSTDVNFGTASKSVIEKHIMFPLLSELHLYQLPHLLLWHLTQRSSSNTILNSLDGSEGLLLRVRKEPKP